MPTWDASVLAWCMMPKLDMLDFWSVSNKHHPRLAHVARPWQRVALRRYGSVLVASTTLNQSRALDPMFADTAPDRILFENPRTWARSVMRLQAHARNTLRWGADFIAGSGREDALRSWAAQAALTAYRLESYLAADLSGYSVIVVATQHDPAIRALIHSAHVQGIPVLYVPHAPAGNNAQYSDLPTSFAGLRGPSEADYYATEFGLDRARLDVVGNPSTDVLSHSIPRFDPDLPGVLALSPYPSSRLQRIIASVRDSGVKRLIVAPHPRSNREELAAIMPDEWILSTEPTLALLRRGVPFLIQHSSGVAWESAALGIPTAKLSFPGEASTYPFLADDEIFPPLHDTGDVQDFIAAAGDADRVRIREHARSWCDTDGEDSVRRIRAVIYSISDRAPSAPPAPILDGWKQPDGPALLRSALTSRALVDIGYGEP